MEGDKAIAVFYDPLHPAGNRLDWCLTWGTQCGQPAADEFCRRRGFRLATSFSQAPRVGLTRVLQDNRMVCWGQPCDSFSYITCSD
jgi:hypothetical protein